MAKSGGGREGERVKRFVTPESREQSAGRAPERKGPQVRPQERHGGGWEAHAGCRRQDSSSGRGRVKRDWRKVKEKKEFRWHSVATFSGGDSEGCGVHKISQEE